MNLPAPKALGKSPVDAKIPVVHNAAGGHANALRVWYKRGVVPRKRVPTATSSMSTLQSLCRRLAAIAALCALAGAASAAAPYYVRVAGTPSPINCGPTTFFFGNGGTLTWSLMNGSQLTVDATSYINGAAQGTQAFTFNSQSGSTSLATINQASISYPSQSYPYLLAVDIVPRDPLTDGVRIAFTCTATGGTNFTSTVIPAPDANLVVSPPSLAFPATVVGVASATQSVTVTNSGNAAATGLSAGVGSAADFAVSGTTCGASLGAGASCSVSVTFVPKSAGTRTATVTLERDHGPGASFGVSGTGIAQLAIPAQVLLGSQAVGTSSAPQAITVHNVGATTVTVASVTSSNAAEFPATTTCAAVPAGGTCTVTVTFAPAAVGQRTAAIRVVSDGVGSPQTITVNGSGIPGGSAAGLLSLPAAVAFGEQAVGSASAPVTVTATNTGGAPVVVSGVASSAPAEFVVAGSTCGTVQAGAQCTFTVAFAPAATGARSAAVTITSNGAGSPQAVPVTGTGTAAAGPGQLAFSGAFAFAAQAVGTTSAAAFVTATNVGGSPVSVSSVTSSTPSEFAVTSSTCTSLPPLASCVVGVAFTPAAAGPRSASIAIASSGAGSPQAVAASGTGVAPGEGMLAVPAWVDAGGVQVGASGDPITVTLATAGGAAVQVASIASGNPAEFAITQSTCTTLVPGATCTFTFVFAPAAAGPRGASVVITSSAAGSPQAVALVGTGVTGPVPLEIVEYHHAAWDHYFMTGIADEIAKLDGGQFTGWARTGLRFKAWPLGTAGADAVCRFFSTAFGERSSHFYTPLAHECLIVRDKPEWYLEGEVFAIAVPTGDGTCPTGTLPVYRLYNDGQGGAPNHRYTTVLAVRAQMIAAGWIPEGYGDIGVIMCAPP